MEQLIGPLYHQEQEVEHEEHNVREVLENVYTLNDFQIFHHIRSLLMWNGMKVLISDVLQLEYLARCYLSRDNTTLLLAECNTSHVIDEHRCCAKQNEKELQERASYKNSSNCNSNCEVAIVEIPLCTSTKFTASCTNANSFSVQFNAPVNYNSRCKTDNVSKYANYEIWENVATVEELTLEIVDDEINFDASKCAKLLQQLSSTTKQESAIAQNRLCHTLQSQCTNEEYTTRARHVDPAAQAMNTTHEPVSVRICEHNKTTICNLTSGLLSMLNEYNQVLSSMCANIHAQQSKVKKMQRELLLGINTHKKVDHVFWDDEFDSQSESSERKMIFKPDYGASNENELTNKHTCGEEYVDVTDNDAQLEEEHQHPSQREEEQVEYLEKEEILENRLTNANKSADKYSIIETANDLSYNELPPYKSELIADHGNEDSINIVNSINYNGLTNTHYTTEKNEQNDEMLTFASHAVVEDAEEMEQQQEENVCVNDDISFVSNNNIINTNNDNNENATAEVATARTIVHTIEPRRETINTATSATMLSTGGRSVEVHSQSTPNVQNLMELMFVNAHQRLEHSLSSEHYEEEEELEEEELELEELSSQEFYREELDEQEPQSHLSHLQRPGSAHVHLSSGLGIVGPNAQDEEALRMYAEIHGKPFHANPTYSTNNQNNNKTSTYRIDSANCSDISKFYIGGGSSNNSSSSTSTTYSAYSSTTHSSLSATEHHAKSLVHTNM